MIYFASDIHLGGGTPAQAQLTERAFCRWLDMVADDATEIYLLGDIFDFWFEYLRVVPQGFSRTLGRLATLHDRGVRVVLFSGNHDMWTYDYLTRECGVEIVRKPEVVRVGGVDLHLAHGDNMNISGKPLLQLMNWGFRSPVLRTLFSWLVHPDIALRFGQWWSGTSRKSHAKDDITPSSLGFLIDYARNYKAQNPTTDYILFGHMHYPYDLKESDLRLLFLGCWDGDEATYAVMDDKGNIELKNF